MARSVVRLAAVASFAIGITACAGGSIPGADIAEAALGGQSVGGIDLGKAVGVAKGAGDAMREIPVAEEIEIGRSVSAGLLGAAPLTDAPAQQAYVNSLGMWLAMNSERPDLPWRFGIIESPTVNAFAAPGGNVFVTRGLVELCQSEAELAGVLAHEIAHVVAKHQLHDIQKNAKKGVLLELASLKSGGLTGDAARAVARVGLEGYVQGLSREDELAADRMGVVLAARSGYDPYGLVVVLQSLAAQGQDTSTALFLKTHPAPSDRLAALEAEMPPSFEKLSAPNPALKRYSPVFRPAAATR
jgi:predicted Zn-dependent protease